MKTFYRHTLNAILFLVVAGSSFSIGAGSKSYHWLDSQGNPVHSDQPPPAGIDYEVTSDRSIYNPAADEEGTASVEDKPEGNEFSQQVSSQEVREETNTQRCERAKSNLQTLNESDTVAIRNAQGEAQDLSPEEMQIERVTAKAQIEFYCQE